MNKLNYVQILYAIPFVIVMTNITFFGIIGVNSLQENNPDFWDENPTNLSVIPIIVTWDLVWNMFSISAILVLGYVVVTIVLPLIDKFTNPKTVGRGKN